MEYVLSFHVLSLCNLLHSTCKERVVWLMKKFRDKSIFSHITIRQGKERIIETSLILEIWNNFLRCKTPPPTATMDSISHPLLLTCTLHFIVWYNNNDESTDTTSIRHCLLSGFHILTCLSLCTMPCNSSVYWTRCSRAININIKDHFNLRILVMNTVELCSILY